MICTLCSVLKWVLIHPTSRDLTFRVKVKEFCFIYKSESKPLPKPMTDVSVALEVLLF